MRPGVECSSYLDHLHSGPDPNRPKKEVRGASPTLLRSRFRRECGMRKHARKFVSLIAFTVAVAIFVPPRAAADQHHPPPPLARLTPVCGSAFFLPPLTA